MGEVGKDSMNIVRIAYLLGGIHADDEPTGLDVFVDRGGQQVAAQESTQRVDELGTEQGGKGSFEVLTICELKKPGMASKNLSSLSSSPRAPIVQSKMPKSISDDRLEVISSAAFPMFPIPYGQRGKASQMSINSLRRYGRYANDMNQRKLASLLRHSGSLEPLHTLVQEQTIIPMKVIKYRRVAYRATPIQTTQKRTRLKTPAMTVRMGTEIKEAGVESGV